MKYTEKNNTIILKELDSFNIEQILECGQCFRFEKIDNMKYEIIAYGKILNIEQSSNSVKLYPCNENEFKNIWYNYFDLERDYSHVKETITKNDDVMKKACEFAPGIRILNQEPWECLISFIISQNNRIPMIKQVIKNISKMYGNEIENERYMFPTVDELRVSDISGLEKCKSGFRAKYILDAVEKVGSGKIDLENLKNFDTNKIKEELLDIKGVGPKVSDCILLFSFGRCEVFPTDVWIKRIMEHFYFNEETTSIPNIHEKAKIKFGKYAGFAQQYLFHYARTILKK